MLEDPKSERKLGLRRITEEQAREIRGEKFVQQERNTNLKMLLNLRPGVFDPEDQAQAAIHQNNIKWVIYPIILAFIGTSATRVWQIKSKNTDVIYGMTGIICSYTPAFIYYQYYQKQYTLFVDEISHKYRDRIRDD